MNCSLYNKNFQLGKCRMDFSYVYGFAKTLFISKVIIFLFLQSFCLSTHPKVLSNWLVPLKLITSSAYTHAAKKQAYFLRETMKKRPSTPRPPNLMIKYLTSAVPSAFKSKCHFRSFSDIKWKWNHVREMQKNKKGVRKRDESQSVMKNKNLC